MRRLLIPAFSIDAKLPAGPNRRSEEVATFEPLFLSFFAGAIAFLVIGCFASLCYADNVEVPKQGFKTQEDFTKYRDEAWAHFQRRCQENAGEKIYRTVKNVRDVFLLSPEGDRRSTSWATNSGPVIPTGMTDMGWKLSPISQTLIEMEFP